MYDLIYNFIIGNIFNSSSLASYETTLFGVTTNMNVWLSHTATIIFMSALLFCAVIFLRFLFRIVSGLFLLK